MKATRFLLIRHAESVWNASGRWQGQGDPELSARGREQAAAAAKTLAGETVDRLISSDLQRALQTASVLGAPHGLVPEPEPRFRELDVGSWTGLTRDEIEKCDPELLRAFEREDPDVRPGGGESRRELRRRVRHAVEAVAADGAHETIVLVAHLGVIRALMPGAEPDHLQIHRATLQQIIDGMERKRRAG